ncbi:hypothetical protein Pfo_012213, partial [Paulownia fortunei]
MAVALPVLSLSSSVRASSVDIQQRLPYNPHRTYPKKPDALAAASASTLTTTLDKYTAKISISDLLKRDISKTTQGTCRLSKNQVAHIWGMRHGCPLLPKWRSLDLCSILHHWLTLGTAFTRCALNSLLCSQIECPRNCQLYARRHFLFPPLNIEEYNDRVMAVVRCEAQDAMLQKLMSDNFLSQEERFGCAAMGEKYWFLQNKNKEASRCGSLQQSIFTGDT